MNLWNTTSDGFKDPADYGKYVPQHYFRAFVLGFPHLWSPEQLWYSNDVPWDCFLPFVQAFNQKRRELLRTVYLLMDESMSAWRPKTSASGGLPNITYEPRKPKPLGTMFKNGVEATTGIMVTQDIVEGSAAQKERKYAGDVSSLPKKEAIMNHVAETLRLCESANLVDGGWVGGDAWFGSIPCVVELKKKLNVHSTFIIKQNLQYCPLQVIQRIMRARNIEGRAAGKHVVMKATISGVPLFLLAYAWSNQRAAYIVSSCGTTVEHEIKYRTHFSDENGNVVFKDIPHPSIAHFYFELCPLIDNHNKDRQSVLALEDCWPTKNPWFRLVTTLIGMAVVDMHCWDRSNRSGRKSFEWLGQDDDIPDFLKVRHLANLIGKGLSKPSMKYYDDNNPRQTFPLRRPQGGYIRRPSRPLERITNEEGQSTRESVDGKKSSGYQQTCFICRQYRAKQQNTYWWCSECNMPLCGDEHKRRDITCYQEHCNNYDDPVLGCHRRKRFVMPNDYKLFGATHASDTINSTSTRVAPSFPALPRFDASAILGGDGAQGTAEGTINNHGNIEQQGVTPRGSKRTRSTELTAVVVRPVATRTSSRTGAVAVSVTPATVLGTRSTRMG